MKRLMILCVGALALAGCTTVAPQAAAPVPPAASAGEILAFEGFEDEAVWMAVAGTWNDGNQSTTARIVASHATEGSKALECSYHFMNDPSKKGASWMTEDILKKNWEGVKAVLIDVDNTTGKPLELDLAVCTGDAWDWYETQLVSVPAGLHRDVRFDLADVKSNVNGWAWGGTVLNAKTVQRVVIQVINGPAQGDSARLYLDNFRLVK